MGAIAALAGAVVALAAFSPSAQAGDVGEAFEEGDIDCVKDAFYEGPAIELGDEVAFEVTCTVDAFAVKFGTVTLSDALVIIDVLPDNFIIESAACLSTDPAEPDITGNLVDIDGQQVTCSWIPSAEGFTYTLEVEGTFLEGPCGDLKNEAEASFGGDFETPAVFLFVECENLAVTKAATTATDGTGATVRPGGTIVYTVEVCNEATGFGEAENVFVVDQLPLGAEFESAASPDFDLVVEGSEITGTKQSLQPGACGAIFITVNTANDAPCGFQFTNVAVTGTLTGNTLDADDSDNTASVTTTVVCADADDDGDHHDGDRPGGGGGGGGPSVSTGDSGLAQSSAVAGWQLGLLSLLMVSSLSVAYLGYNRMR
ncbi:MAG: DUF11 domain-containing protein [Dehalococcoidia bacterium]|nr:DUF11 domain-containing protein [Dehalococcoidia bacterium]